MAKILGLDLGTNSIGWAIIDDTEKKIVDIGVRIFPMGVNNLGDGEGEVSKNAGRTAARGIRRQFFRRRLRKKLLLKALSENEMCPLTEGDFDIWKRSKKFPEEKLAGWFAINPYDLRSRGLNEKLTLHELGRVFYHIIQRRGFLSNSRKTGTNDGTIFKGDPKSSKIGILETSEKIADSTLGMYLNDIYPKEREPFKEGLERIRNRYTTRKMYVDEFEKIWDIQASFHPELSISLKEIFGGRKLDGYSRDGILFYQRPLKSQKHLVGNCSFEPSKTKSPISAIPYELFRIHQWVNTVECNGTRISDDERSKLISALLANEKIEFKKLRKAIGKESSVFKFNYKDDDKIVGTHTISNLSNKKFFGSKWFDFTDKQQDDIWHVLYFFDSKDKVFEYAVNNWEFPEEKAKAIADFNLKDGYGSLSRKAVSAILPYLKQGHLYDVAVVLGGITNVFGKDWNGLPEEKKSLLLDNVPEIVRSGVSGGFINEIKKLLRDEFAIDDKRLNKLYHHSTSINSTTILEKLPVGRKADLEIQSIRNPIVVTALFELRTLMNELLEEHGKPDEIKIEMARDLKVSKIQRNKMRLEQKRQERLNDAVKKRLEEHGQRITHDNLLKYKLWEECKQTCPYTGEQIPIHELFSGNIQIEHIHPWSRSLNDSFLNKTLCYADENRRKGDKTPFEFYGFDENNWSIIKARALKLFSDSKDYPQAYQKFKRFVQQKFDDDFSTRQLNDTRYISREAKSYVAQICNRVFVSPGQMTSTLRHKWGLNSILSDDNQKTREDHRHHAVDALVMACSKSNHLQELSKWNRYERSYELSDFPKPWETFHGDARRIIDAILISHRRVNNILTIRNQKTEHNGSFHNNTGVAARGQLHKETVYGKRTAPKCEEAYHVRKPIESITTEKQIEKIVDPAIRKLILNRVKDLGGFNKGNVPANTFFVVNEEGLKIPQVHLPNKNGEPVPIMKIRMKENFSGAEQLKNDVNQWVNPRNNHHVLIYKTPKGELKEDVVSFWTVVERRRQKSPVYQLPFDATDGAEILTTLHINDMFLIGLGEDEVDWKNPDHAKLKNHLYRVQKLTSGDYFFRKHTSSTVTDEDYKQIRGFGSGKTGWLSFNPIKITISSTGKIRKV